VNIFTFFEHHIAWLYISRIANCLTCGILPLLHLFLEELLHIKYQCPCLWRTILPFSILSSQGKSYRYCKFHC
jgi:hypothetical protein